MQLLVISDWPNGQSEQYTASPADTFMRIESGFYEVDGEHYIEADSLSALAQVYRWLAVPPPQWFEVTPSTTVLARLRHYQPSWRCYREGTVESSDTAYLCLNPIPQPHKFGLTAPLDPQALLVEAATLLYTEHHTYVTLHHSHEEAWKTVQRVQLSYQTELTFRQRLAEHEAAAQRRTSWLAEHKAAEERRTSWLAVAQGHQQVRRFKIITVLLFLLLLLNWLLCHYASA